MALIAPTSLQKETSAQDTPHAERERIISEFKADPIPGEPHSQARDLPDFDGSSMTTGNAHGC